MDRLTEASLTKHSKALKKKINMWNQIFKKYKVLKKMQKNGKWVITFNKPYDILNFIEIPIKSGMKRYNVKYDDKLSPRLNDITEYVVDQLHWSKFLHKVVIILKF